jgi:bifunctional non-homologous end joining protein LigD
VAKRRAADPFPKLVDLKLATLVAAPPEGDGWIHEIKHDGYRLVCFKDGGSVVLRTRGDYDWTERFPAIALELQKLKAKQAILDGELCAMREDGTTSFHELQKILASKRTGGLVYLAFDLLYFDGADLRKLPLLERKERLEALLSGTPRTRVAYVDHLVGQGAEFFKQACQQDLEGIVSKQAHKPYSAGRSPDWQKSKCQHEEVFFVGGYRMSTQNPKVLGALMLGRKKGKKLEYAGQVGFGFTAKMQDELLDRLRKIQQEKSPFEGKVAEKGFWVKPSLKVEVRYSTQSKTAQLRHATFRGVVE